MIQSIDTDSGLNAYAIIRDGSNNIANGSGFESLDTNNWSSLYAITSPEQSNTGHYFITVPAYVAAGNYAITFYERLGSSPAVGDRVLGTHNFTVSTSSTLPASPTTLIDQMRILANDTSVSNTIIKEIPTGTADGSNKYFRLQYQNIVTASVYMSYASTFRTQLGFSLDSTNGIITFTAAPANATVLLADYNFNWFSDSDYVEFLNDGARLLLNGGNDPTQVIQGLIPSLLQYALYYFWVRRSTQYAHRYSSSGGQAGQSVETVTKNFLNLAGNAMKMGSQFRDDYYKRQGQREVPSSGIISYGFDPYTPQR